MPVELDHVILAVDDLATAADELARRYGLPSVQGGRHAGWGTANRIIPLGDTYVELIAVVDADEAATSDFGRWVASSNGLLGWAVRTNDLDATAQRLGLAVGGGSRPTADGSILRWRSAGVEAARDAPALPFFLEWDPSGTHPGRAAAPADATIERIVVRGDADRIASWLGPHDDLPLVVEPGPPELAAVVLVTPRGEIALG